MNSDTNVAVVDEGDNKILKLVKTANGDSKLYKKLTGLKENNFYELSFKIKITVNTETAIVGYAGVSAAEPVGLNEAQAFEVKVPPICSYFTDNENASYSSDNETRKGVICFSSCSDWATYKVSFASTGNEAYFYIENSGNQQDIYLDSIKLVQSDSNGDYALSDLNVPDASADTVNVLMIGNSYTVDATRELAVAGGIIEAGDKDLRIARLVKGSKNVAYYKEQIENNSGDMGFKYYTKDTEVQSKEGVSFKSAVNMIAAKGQKWDYIVVQAATNSEWKQYSNADSEQNQKLEALVECLKEQEGCDKCEVVIYCTWSASDEFVKGNTSYIGYNTQEEQHNAIIQGVKNIKAATGCDVINMEEIFYDIRNDDELKIGDNLNRDGYHLSNIGATAVGLAIYEFFTDTAVTESSWTKTTFSQYSGTSEPKPFSATQIEGVKKIVHKYISCKPNSRVRNHENR